ncbi:hypothetical protein V8F20_010645 [Naviculisporaceae sp. PSN 640]
MLYQRHSLVFGGLCFLSATGASASAIRPLAAGADDNEPQPAPWTPLTMALPWPYQSPSISIPSNSPQTAVLGLLYSNPCGGATEFASTKTVNLPVDCHGASSLSVSLRVGRCPLGRTDGPPATVDTVTATPRTSFGYTCLPTPTPIIPTPSVNLADITRTLPLPTLTKGQTPPLTAKALEVVHHPGGECQVDLTLEGRKGEDRAEWNSKECEKRLLDTVTTTYATTVRRTVEVGCDGCQYIRGGVVTPSCPRETVSKSVQEEKVTTVWVYDCLKR